MFNFGLLAVFVGPAAFLAGTIVWRTLPEGIPYYGPVAGMLATVLTYTVAMGFIALPMIVFETPPSESPHIVIGSFDAAVIGILAFMGTYWLTLPLGAVSGHIHERARENLTE